MSSSPSSFSYSSSPTSYRPAPRFLAYDEVRGAVVGYDAAGNFLGDFTTSGSMHEKRQSTGCALLDLPSLEQLPLFHNITDIAAQTWGADWDRYLVNPPEYLDNPALACTVGVASLELDGEPQCTSTVDDSVSVVADAQGQATMSYSTGSTYSVKLEVSQTANFPAQQQAVNGAITVPALHQELRVTAPTSNFSLSNQQSGAGAVLQNSDEAIVNVTATVQPSQSCFLQLTTLSCIATGQAQVHIAAQGWLWFNYGTVRGTGTDTHYKWAIWFDGPGGGIPNVDDRSAYMSVTALSIKSSGVVDKKVQCAVADRSAPSTSESSASPTAIPTTAQTAPSTRRTSFTSRNAIAIAVPIVACAGILAIIVFFYLRLQSRRFQRKVIEEKLSSNRQNSEPAITPFTIRSSLITPYSFEFSKHPPEKFSAKSPVSSLARLKKLYMDPPVYYP